MNKKSTQDRRRYNVNCQGCITNHEMHGSTLIFHSSDSNKSYSLTQKYGGAYSTFGAAAQERSSPRHSIGSFHQMLPSLAVQYGLLFPS
ncbi:MAG: hypothetical protein K2K41_06915 [Ruminiclostridium sp.]|nr:hypothetical protein [Ruminiclostridium sp.]